MDVYWDFSLKCHFIRMKNIFVCCKDSVALLNLWLKTRIARIYVVYQFSKVAFADRQYVVPLAGKSDHVI